MIAGSECRGCKPTSIPSPPGSEHEIAAWSAVDDEESPYSFLHEFVPEEAQSAGISLGLKYTISVLIAALCTCLKLEQLEPLLSASLGSLF